MKSQKKYLFALLNIIFMIFFAVVGGFVGFFAFLGFLTFFWPVTVVFGIIIGLGIALLIMRVNKREGILWPHAGKLSFTGFLSGFFLVYGWFQLLLHPVF